MEAIAKHDFNATADDELSFRKNQILKVRMLIDLYSLIFKYRNVIFIVLIRRFRQSDSSCGCSNVRD